MPSTNNIDDELKASLYKLRTIWAGLALNAYPVQSNAYSFYERIYSVNIMKIFGEVTEKLEQASSSCFSNEKLLLNYQHHLEAYFRFNRQNYRERRQLLASLNSACDDLDADSISKEYLVLLGIIFACLISIACALILFVPPIGAPVFSIAAMLGIKTILTLIFCGGLGVGPFVFLSLINLNKEYNFNFRNSLNHLQNILNDSFPGGEHNVERSPGDGLSTYSFISFPPPAL